MNVNEPVAYGFPNSAITGNLRWMLLRENLPANDEYRGALWVPLVLQSDLDAAQKRIAELEAAQQWQPIETAPKDRQILLAAQFDHENDWRIKTGWWNDEIDEWHVLGASWSPTRWMPLPAPPALTGEPR